MKKRLFIVFACCFAMASMLLLFGSFVPITVAYAEEVAVAPVIGKTYTFSDEDAQYSITILPETKYKMNAVLDNEKIDYKGIYTYADGKLTLKAMDSVLGVFYIEGSNLVEIAKSEEADTTIEDTVTNKEEVDAALENYTLLGRICEYICANYIEIATTLGDIILAIMFIVNYFKNKSKLAAMNTNINNTAASQNSVVQAANGLIDGYNSLDEAFGKTTKQLEEFFDSEKDKTEKLGALITQSAAVLDILTTVYANSKNLPQGVKDLVNLKYASALKTVQDSQACQAIGEAALSEEKKDCDETPPEET